MRTRRAFAPFKQSGSGVFALCVVVASAGSVAATLAAAAPSAAAASTVTRPSLPWPHVVAHLRRAALRLPDVGRSATSSPLEGSAPGTQVLRQGMVGWEVAALQLLVAEAGFASGPIDGRFGARTEAAVRRYQTWLGLDPDGVAGRATLGALAAPPPLLPRELRRPVRASITSAFGLRGGRFHTGVDLGAPLGTPVTAAACGRVTWAGWRDGGWGKLVVVAHGDGVRSLYAHLDSIDVLVGQVLAAGGRIGTVGASGRAAGAHLHFEARLRGASVDPEPALRRSR